MLKNAILATLLLGLVLSGCGSNDDGGSDAGGATAGTNGTAGTSSGTNGGGGTSAGTGNQTGDGGLNFDAGITLTCDETITSVATCGTETCPTPSAQAEMFCQVACCTGDNKCGTKNTSDRASGMGLDTCMLPPEADPRCEGKLTGPLAMAGDACCTMDGNCGVIFGGTVCVDPSGVFGGTPVKCDDEDGGM